MSHYDCPCMEKCPLHYAMSLIGGKWKVQILCSVTNAGTIRYNALRGKLVGISNTVLASALRELERDGLVYSQRTAGRFVTEDQAMIASAKRSLAERHIQAFLEAMTHLGYDREEILTLLRQEESKGGEDNGSSGV